MKRQPAGLGRKHPQLNISLSKLSLDPENPRLPEETQGKKEQELLEVLYRDFSLDELADSMSQNGYFDEEPLVAIPQKLPRKLENVDVNSKEFVEFINDETTTFIVVEGNRRLATIKLLTDVSYREKFRIKSWPSLSPEVHDDLTLLPVIIYRKRSDVIPYLGVRHIVGIQKWDSYAKARYIANMIESGMSISEIESQIGDKTGALIRNYVCFKILDQASSEFDFNSTKAKSDFSLLLLAIGQGNIKRYLGLPSKLKETDNDAPVPNEKIDNLKNLLVWMYGTDKSRPVINESRDITNYLSHIVTSEVAITYLNEKLDVRGAYDRTDGEEKMVLKYLNSINSKLESVLSVVHRHKTEDVLGQVTICEQTVKAIKKIVAE